MNIFCKASVSYPFCCIMVSQLQSTLVLLGFSLNLKILWCHRVVYELTLFPGDLNSLNKYLSKPNWFFLLVVSSFLVLHNDQWPVFYDNCFPGKILYHKIFFCIHREDGTSPLRCSFSLCKNKLWWKYGPHEILLHQLWGSLW